MEVSLGPGDFVLDGDPATSPKRGRTPIFVGLFDKLIFFPFAQKNKFCENLIHSGFFVLLIERLSFALSDISCTAEVHRFPFPSFFVNLHFYLNCIIMLTFWQWVRYTIQPVVKPVGQPAASCKQTSNRLSNRFNRLDVCLHDTAGCQTGLTTGWMFVYTIQPVVKQVWQPVWQPVSQPAVSCIQTFSRYWTTSWMSVYTMQPVVKPVVQPVWQPVVSCKRGLRASEKKFN